MEFEEYGSLLLFHLPPTLQHLRARNFHTPFGPNHLRFLPPSLKTLHLYGELGDVLPIEALMDAFPRELTSLHLNAAFSVSKPLLGSLPRSLLELDVHASKDVPIEILDVLPRGLKSLNLHRNLVPSSRPSTEELPPKLPPKLTRATLPSVWNSTGWSSDIPKGLTSLTTSSMQPIHSDVVLRWGSHLTSLTISRSSLSYAHSSSSSSSSSSSPSPSSLSVENHLNSIILNILPRTLTVLSCPYTFLGVQMCPIQSLRWPPKLIELALFQAHRAPLEFFHTFPQSLRCLYLGDTQYHGEFVAMLPRRLAWLQLKTPIHSEYLQDLPPHLLALVASVLSPTTDALEDLPKSLRYLHTPNLQIEFSTQVHSSLAPSIISIEQLRSRR